MKNKIATSKFCNYGLRRNWLIFFLHNTENWFVKNNLGDSQIKSLKIWLKESELIDKNNRPTALAKSLSTIINTQELLIWEIVWTNLYYNVKLIQWYLDTFYWSETISRENLTDRLIKEDKANERTARNAILSLLNFFSSSPIGYKLKIGIVEKKGKKRYVRKIGTNSINSLAIAYSLYKAAEHTERKDFTVSELYNAKFNGGPYKLFGMSKEKLERILRGLQENNILKVDLIADLDNIYLRSNFSPLDIAKIAVKSKGGLICY